MRSPESGALITKQNQIQRRDENSKSINKNWLTISENYTVNHENIITVNI